MACQEYVPTEWFDNTAPAINAANLNHIEIGITSVTNCAVAQEISIAENRTDIDTNTTNIATNTTNIAANTTNIATNIADIAANLALINTNIADIAANTSAIAALTTRVTNLESSLTSHTHTIAQVVDLQNQLNSKPTGTWSRSGTTLNIDISGS